MSASSNYLERKLLDHALGEGARTFTSPATIYVALFNNTSGLALANLEAGTLTDEVSTSGTAYGRQGVTFSTATTASNGTSSSTTSGDITWSAATASWGTVTHLAIMDSGTAGAGNCLFFGALTTSKAIDTSDIFKITAGNLTVQLA